jgi:hypothetical protein
VGLPVTLHQTCPRLRVCPVLAVGDSLCSACMWTTLSDHKWDSKPKSNLMSLLGRKGGRGREARTARIHASPVVKTRSARQCITTWILRRRGWGGGVIGWGEEEYRRVGGGGIPEGGVCRKDMRVYYGKRKCKMFSCLACVTLCSR